MMFFLIQEEIFLSQLLTAMHVSPETSRLTDNPGMLRGFVSQFREVPHIFKRGEENLKLQASKS